MSYNGEFPRIVLSVIAVSAMLPLQPVNAVAEKSVGAESGSQQAKCDKLMTEYDEVSRKLALSKAYESVDDNALRSATRSSENQSSIEQAKMAFDIMKSLGCKLPTHTPSADRYAWQSIQCASALQTQRTENAKAIYLGKPLSFKTPMECDSNQWPINAE